MMETSRDVCLALVLKCYLTGRIHRLLFRSCTSRSVEVIFEVAQRFHVSVHYFLIYFVKQ